MPTWSPDDSEIAFASSRENYQGLWAVNLASGAERSLRTVKGGKVDAPSWGPGGQLLYHVAAGGQNRFEIDGKSVTGSENVFAFRASWASGSEFVYVSDGKIRKRSVSGLPMQTVEFTATLQVTRPQYTRRARDFTSAAPRRALGIVRPSISPDGRQVAFAAVGDIYVMPVGGSAVNVTKDAALDTDPAWSPDGGSLVYSSDKDSEFLQLWIRDMKTRPEPQGHQPHDAATGRVVLARRQARGLLQCRRHVAGRRDVGPRPRERPGDEDSRFAAAAGRADVVARRPAHCARRHCADDRAVPRGHQPGPDHLGLGRRRRSGTRRSPCSRSTRAAAPVRRGHQTAPRWLRFTKACCRCGPSPSPASRRVRRAASPRRARTRQAGKATRGTSSISRSTSCASSTSRPVRARPSRWI